MQMFQLLCIQCFHPTVSACVFSFEMSVWVCSHDSYMALIWTPSSISWTEIGPFQCLFSLIALKASSCKVTRVFYRSFMLHCGCTTEMNSGQFGYGCVYVDASLTLWCLHMLSSCSYRDLLNCNFLVNGNLNGVLEAKACMLNHNI